MFFRSAIALAFAGTLVASGSLAHPAPQQGSSTISGPARTGTTILARDAHDHDRGDHDRGGIAGMIMIGAVTTMAE
jgi:hypothetical protein